MKTTQKMRVLAVVIIAVLLVGGLVGASFLMGKDKVPSASADTTVEENAEDTEGEVAEDPEQDEKIEEFENKWKASEKLEEAAVSGWLDKWGIPYETNEKGEIVVSADDTIKTIFYQYDDERTKSSVKIGLSKHPISDAPGYVFDFAKKQVEKILAAEEKGYGTKIDFSKKEIKQLVKQDVRTMISNVVIGIGHAEQVSGLYYGKSKTVYELSSSVKFLVDETNKAFEPDETGYAEGMNIWVEKNGDHWVVTQEYLRNIIPVINQLVEGAEISAEACYAEYNWGLSRGDSAQLRRCVLSTEPDTKASLIYRHYFKDGELMEQPATNLRDRRPEIPANPKPKKAKKQSHNPDPAPDPAPGYTPDPSHRRKPDPEPGSKVKPTPVPSTAPTPTPIPTVTPTPYVPPYVPPTATPIGTKNPEAAPTARPNDDPGPGQPEVTPRVPKSPSDEVSELQYQPQASPQGGGTSTPRDSIINNPTATTAPGGQIVTDPHNGNERIENDQASTDPIETRPSDTGGAEGNNNGAIAAPD